MSNYYQHLQLNGPISVQAANIAKHAAERNTLGQAVIITDDVQSMSISLRKAWQKLASETKQLRDETLNTDEKLRLTQRLIKLQSTHIGPSSVSQLMVCDHLPDSPAMTKTIYLAGRTSSSLDLTRLCSRPYSCLIVGSIPSTVVQAQGLLPKSRLDSAANDAWKDILRFLASNNIQLDKLITPRSDRLANINDALGTLLDDTTARQFIALMNEFHILARKAMPLNWSRSRTREQQTLAVLAAQITAYTPGLSVLSLADNEDPLFFLSDVRHITTAWAFWNAAWVDSSFSNDHDTPALAFAGLV